jgi:hypothetical protein
MVDQQRIGGRKRKALRTPARFGIETDATPGRSCVTRSSVAPLSWIVTWSPHRCMLPDRTADGRQHAVLSPRGRIPYLIELTGRR